MISQYIPCLYLKKSVISQHLLQPSVFSVVGSLITSWENPNQSICQGHCVYYTTPVEVIHYNKQSVVDSKKFEEYIYLMKVIVALHF